MAIIFDQKPESGTMSFADGKVVHEYQLIGTADEFPTEVEAATYLLTAAPVFFQGAWLQDVQIKPQGNGLYYVTLPYGPYPNTPGGPAGSLRINFNTTGGTVHISTSLGMVAMYGTDVPPTDVIGQDGQGAEITVPVQMRSYTVHYASGIVTETAMDYWENATGTVNLIPWHLRPAGEVLFLGAEGDTTISADSNSSVTFRFAMSRNKTGQTIGSISGIAKQGHDLIDIHTIESTSGIQKVQVAKFVYIQRVYERINFAAYLGF